MNEKPKTTSFAALQSTVEFHDRRPLYRDGTITFRKRLLPWLAEYAARGRLVIKISGISRVPRPYRRQCSRPRSPPDSDNSHSVIPLLQTAAGDSGLGHWVIQRTRRSIHIPQNYARTKKIIYFIMEIINR